MPLHQWPGSRDQKTLPESGGLGYTSISCAGIQSPQPAQVCKPLLHCLYRDWQAWIASHIDGPNRNSKCKEPGSASSFRSQCRFLERSKYKSKAWEDRIVHLRARYKWRLCRLKWNLCSHFVSYDKQAPTISCTESVRSVPGHLMQRGRNLSSVRGLLRALSLGRQKKPRC